MNGGQWTAGGAPTEYVYTLHRLVNEKRHIDNNNMGEIKRIDHVKPLHGASLDPPPPALYFLAAGAAAAAASRLSLSAARVHFGFCSTITTVQPAASSLARAVSDMAAASTVSFLVITPSPSTFREGGV